ncbi:MAG: PEGA domain-containing protein [Kiritimatiellae bacterium]|nr:PEGA domain-containing protein [Kiritimatiellia bacterium]
MKRAESRPAAYFAAFLAAFAVAAGAFGTPAQKKPVRVDLTSRPEAAEVAVDGEVRGVTPLSLFDLAPGTHRARFSLKGHESADEFFEVADSPHVLRHAALEPLKGLLLLTTEPAGCEVSQDGISLGTTPRLIVSLDVNKPHKLLLSKNGCQSKTIEIRFNSRAPLVRHEKLVLDSGSLSVSSVPVGAKVTVDGMARGVAPLVLSDIPKGRVAVTFELEGYETAKREISVAAGETKELAVALEPIPGSLFVTSVPDAARIYVDGEACGKAPVSLERVKPGVHLVRAELDGYGTVAREVKVSLAQKASAEFRLESVRGRLEVRTSPPGAQVVVDGRPAGTTKASGSSSSISDVLMIENLDAGEHTLVVRRDGYAEVVKHPVVETSRTAVTTVRLHRVFTPNVEIITWSGSYKGVFVDRTAEALTIEVSMGVSRTFMLSEIREINWLLDGAGKGAAK